MITSNSSFNKTGPVVLHSCIAGMHFKSEHFTNCTNESIQLTKNVNNSRCDCID